MAGPIEERSMHGMYDRSGGRVVGRWAVFALLLGACGDSGPSNACAMLGACTPGMDSVDGPSGPASNDDASTPTTGDGQGTDDTGGLTGGSEPASCDACNADQVCIAGACTDVPGTCPCPLETYCDLADSTCVIGCTKDEECDEGRICDTVERVCFVGCRQDGDCGADQICEDLACIEGCREDSDCGAVQLCEQLVCVPNVCGDGVLGADEQCDDGNLQTGDGCGATCVPEGCGNGLVEADEQCDDGNQSDTDTCTTACKVPTCGDGLLQPPETCDLGPDNSDSGQCSSACTKAGCGDSLLWEGKEQCDDGPNNGNTKWCTSSCKHNLCGDGLVGPAEGCDDGNASNNDMCTTACKSSTCGDGVKQMGELCDLGMNNKNTGVCTLSCKNAACGDGFLQADEQCDDGNGSNTDACLNTCTTAECGDGVVWKGHEQCDDGDDDGNDGCNSDCTRPKLVFLSSSSWTGDLGGLPGGDAKCQGLAAAAGLPGTYKAWLSDATLAPDSRFTKSTTGYALTNGLEVAQTWADLVDGTLDVPINITQTTAMVGPADVWTGTDSLGQSLAEDCAGWSTDGASVVGYDGRNDAKNGSWTTTGLDSASNCATAQRLYCFQQ